MLYCHCYSWSSNHVTFTWIDCHNCRCTEGVTLAVCSVCVLVYRTSSYYIPVQTVVVMWSTLINKVMIIWYMKLHLFLSLIDWGMVACYDNKWVDLLFCKVLYIANILMNLCTLSCLWLGHDVIALNVLCRTNLACFLYMYKVQYLYPLVQRSDGRNFSERSFMAIWISYVTHLKEIVLIRYSSLDLNTMHNFMYEWEQLPIHLSSNELTWSVCSFVNILFFTFSQKPLTISN